MFAPMSTNTSPGRRLASITAETPGSHTLNNRIIRWMLSTGSQCTVAPKYVTPSCSGAQRRIAAVYQSKIPPPSGPGRTVGRS